MSDWRVTSEYYDGETPAHGSGREPDDRRAEDADRPDTGRITVDAAPDDSTTPPAVASTFGPILTSEDAALVPVAYAVPAYRRLRWTEPATALLFIGIGLFIASTIVDPSRGHDWTGMVIPLGYYFSAESNRAMRDMVGWFGLVPTAALPLLLLSLRLGRTGRFGWALIVSSIALGFASITLILGILGIVAWPGFPVSVLVWWSGLLCVEAGLAIAVCERQAPRPVLEGS